MEKRDPENDYGQEVNGKVRRGSRWSIGEKSSDHRQDPFGDEVEGDVKYEAQNLLLGKTC
jgi:hypothetical protein